MTTETTNRRTIANRAEVYALQLRRLANDTEQAAKRPTDWKAAGVLEADRVETVGAGMRIREMLTAEDEKHSPANALHVQLAAICNVSVEPPALHAWADRWDAYALEIDP